METPELLAAIDAALAGHWEKSHRIVQQYEDPVACWIHAVLHRIEGDVGNSHYWYRRARREPATSLAASAELEAIRRELSASS